VKLVIATVRRDKANDVMQALGDAGIQGYSLTRAQGHADGAAQIQMYRGTTIRTSLSERVRFEIAVPDAMLWRTVDAVCAGARTGGVGDGDIVVLDLKEALQIHTGEQPHDLLEPVA